MNTIVKQDLKIENMIYEIRGKQVMFDSDLAKLYECKNGTKDINKAVKRNLNKFPEDFYFQLTEEELKGISLRFQIGTLNSVGNKRGQHIKYLPHVFTEQGVAMLASVLHTEVADEMSIRIMRTFVAMRHYLMENKDIYKSLDNINNKLIEHDDKLDYIFSRFRLNSKEFLKGDFYTEYSYIKDILEMAKEEIIIIDPYIDKKMLDLVRNIDALIKIITSSKAKLTKTEIEEFNKSYNKLEVLENNDFHDRFIVIDNKDFYHIGTSINYAGSKFTIIDRIEDFYIQEAIMKEIRKNH